MIIGQYSTFYFSNCISSFTLEYFQHKSTAHSTKCTIAKYAMFFIRFNRQNKTSQEIMSIEQKTKENYYLHFEFAMLSMILHI